MNSPYSTERVTPNDAEKAVAEAMENVRSGYNEYENLNIQRGLKLVIAAAVECKRLANVEEVRHTIALTNRSMADAKTRVAAYEAKLTELLRGAPDGSS